MNYLKPFLLLFSAFLIIAPADAQIWKKVQRSVERTAEKRAEQEAEKATNDAIDEALEDNDDSNQEEGHRKNNKMDLSNFGFGSSEDVPDQYKFNFEIEYKITSNKDVSNITYLLDDKEEYFGFLMNNKKGNTKMVLDMGNNMAIMFMTDEKGERSGQMLPAMLSKEYLSEKIEEANGDIKVEKTGRTKVLLGYDCHEYKATSPEGVSEAWIATEIKTSLTKVFGASMSKNKKAKNMAEIMKYMDGFIMESHYRDHKKEKNNVDMMATRVNTNPEPIRKADYKWTM